eukprot:13221238-Alexandrium_andersonii.AAC.1
MLLNVPALPIARAVYKGCSHEYPGLARAACGVTLVLQRVTGARIRCRVVSSRYPWAIAAEVGAKDVRGGDRAIHTT